MFKFRFMGSSADRDDPNLGPGPPMERNALQAIFPVSYYIVSQSTLIIFVILIAAYSKRLPPPDKRIFASLLCTLVFYLVNLVFCKLITDTCKSWCVLLF